MDFRRSRYAPTFLFFLPIRGSRDRTLRILSSGALERSCPKSSGTSHGTHVRKSSPALALSSSSPLASLSTTWASSRALSSASNQFWSCLSESSYSLSPLSNCPSTPAGRSEEKRSTALLEMPAWFLDAIQIVRESFWSSGVPIRKALPSAGV